MGVLLFTDRTINKKEKITSDFVFLTTMEGGIQNLHSFEDILRVRGERGRKYDTSWGRKER